MNSLKLQLNNGKKRFFNLEKVSGEKKGAKKNVNLSIATLSFKTCITSQISDPLLRQGLSKGHTISAVIRSQSAKSR